MKWIPSGLHGYLACGESYPSQLMSSSHELQISKLDEAIAEIYPYRGRTEQLEALRVLIFERRDLMLVAKTSFGKSMIMQALPCLVPNAVVIIVLPLNVIGSEQVKKIAKLPYVRPVHVWDDSTSCADGEYPHGQLR